MREVLILGLIVVAVLGAWLFISSTTVSSGGLSAHEKVLANEMQQLVDFYKDSPITPAMPDHKIRVLPDGSGMFFHFNAPYGQESQLLWIGQLVPGRFCKADQQQVEAAYGAGFSHFHKKFTPGSNPEAGHGGVGGEDGYWFRHIAVTNIPQGDMMKGTGVPWGPVSPGVDVNFMPTAAPEC